MLKKVPLEQSIGTNLAHDITEVRPGEFKGPAFRKGHRVCEEDICHLQRLGKNHLYVVDLEADELHENEAAALLAAAIAGPGVVWRDDPREGKIEMFAENDGLVRVDTAALGALNMIDEVMCATVHTHTRIRKGELVAATRAIPLVVKREPVERATAIARSHGAIVEVLPLRPARVGLIITGDEVYHGRIRDGFEPILRGKLADLGARVQALAFLPDDAERIAEKIGEHLQAGCDLLLLTGGMSVDPDDVTRHGIRLAGADDMHYGTAVLPGAMLLVAYVGAVPIIGVPACGLHHPATALDLVLPRILAGERIGKAQLAFLGHGSLCRQCPTCSFPRCAFGITT
ncbi:molybdopterin-binding protein [Desulfatitalea tepidiphila]|uniref:molybdopterin-binding protein n=1 Tax=Desulfatitalea tepidiphila TaxID=1185843 RepID=UPI0006B40812|nr:molybdopterin-binding protein [Desulfatitalea tepidiphila]